VVTFIKSEFFQSGLFTYSTTRNVNTNYFHEQHHLTGFNSPDTVLGTEFLYTILTNFIPDRIHSSLTPSSLLFWSPYIVLQFYAIAFQLLQLYFIHILEFFKFNLHTPSLVLTYWHDLIKPSTMCPLLLSLQLLFLYYPWRNLNLCIFCFFVL
jgi:hypothetical protein